MSHVDGSYFCDPDRRRAISSHLFIHSGVASNRVWCGLDEKKKKDLITSNWNQQQIIKWLLYECIESHFHKQQVYVYW